MLKKRIIPVLLLQSNRLVKGVQFSGYRDTGTPKTAIRVYSAQDADELILLNISASEQSRLHMLEIIKEASRECFMPLTVGGGIRSTADIQDLLLAGADKVVITSAAAKNPSLITEASNLFGSQCIVAGIDHRTNSNSSSVWVNSGSVQTNYEPEELAIMYASMGAGEIFINSITRDGVMGGFDLDVAKKVSEAVSVPVIVAGGAGNLNHLAELFTETSASAAACSSIFHFGDNNPIRARSHLRNLGIPMRSLK